MSEAPKQLLSNVVANTHIRLLLFIKKKPGDSRRIFKKFQPI